MASSSGSAGSTPLTSTPGWPGKGSTETLTGPERKTYESGGGCSTVIGTLHPSFPWAVVGPIPD